MNNRPNSHIDGYRNVNADVPVYDVATLLQRSREAIILHGGERYRLRITSNGKLILTK